MAARTGPLLLPLLLLLLLHIPRSGAFLRFSSSPTTLPPRRGQANVLFAARPLPTSLRRQFGGSNFTYASGYTPQNGRSLRVVAISDSHGFERGMDVPEGDVLVHCGDFAPSSKIRAGMDSFGRWLATLPHPYKIIVRGNHDPERIPALATYTDVMFVHRPMSINISGVQFSVAPYPVKGKLHKGVTSGAVLASHVPPYGVLDECVTGGKHIGDLALRRSVEGWSEKPKVWLCGHVHESFGAKDCDFRVPLKKTSGHKTKYKSRSSRSGSSSQAGGARPGEGSLKVGEGSGGHGGGGGGGGDGNGPSTAADGVTLCLNVAAANDGRAVRLHEERTARVFLIDTETQDVQLVE